MEHDIVVKMSPEKLTAKMRVKSIKQGELLIVEPERFDCTEQNCYDNINDVCRMGHSAGTGSPIRKCCPSCNEWGKHPGGIVCVDGEEMFSK
jgi:hypothetical protein